MNLSPDDQQLEQELRDLPRFHPSVDDRQKQWQRISRELSSAKRGTMRRFVYAAAGAFAVALLTFGTLQQFGVPSLGGGGSLGGTPTLPVADGFVGASYPPHGKVFANLDELPPEDQAKAAVLEKMGYAYENFNTMQATVLYGNSTALGDVQEQHIEITMRQGLYPAVYENIRERDGNSMQYVANNAYMWIKSSQQPELLNPITPYDPSVMPIGHTGFVRTEANGTKSYATPADPARSMYGESIVTPLRTLSLYLLDIELWSIAGEEQLLGRKAVRLEGQMDDYFQKKMQVLSYKVWIDDITGILLKFELHDASGKTVEYFELTSLELNGRIDAKRFEIPIDVIQKHASPTGDIKK